MDPTQAGFLAWVRAVMGISTDNLPDDSPAIYWAFATALALVNPQIQQAGALVPGGAISYQQAVYNLAGDNLINFAQDAANAPVYQDNLPFFAYMRKQFGCMDFAGGVVASASDEGTGDSLAVIEGLKNLTVGQLQNLKTPWGRQYIAIASSVGSLWGLT